ETADAADTERVGDRQLARIDDVAALFQRIVEALEDEIRMARRTEGGDDRRLQRVGKQRFEAERAHAANEDARVLRVARAAAGDAALGEELLQRLVERDDDMDRRGEAVLPGLLEIAALVEQVERQRRRIALGLGERFAPADDEAEPRHAFEALVGGGRDRVERRFARVELE